MVLSPLLALSLSHPLSFPLAQECPCVLMEEVLEMLQNHSSEPNRAPVIRTTQGQLLSLGEEVPPNSTITAACNNW